MFAKAAFGRKGRDKELRVNCCRSIVNFVSFGYSQITPKMRVSDSKRNYMFLDQYLYCSNCCDSTSSVEKWVLRTSVSTELTTVILKPRILLIPFTPDFLYTPLSVVR